MRGIWRLGRKCRCRVRSRKSEVGGRRSERFIPGKHQFHRLRATNRCDRRSVKKVTMFLPPKATRLLIFFVFCTKDTENYADEETIINSIDLRAAEDRVSARPQLFPIL